MTGSSIIYKAAQERLSEIRANRAAAELRRRQRIKRSTRVD